MAEKETDARGGTPASERVAAKATEKAPLAVVLEGGLCPTDLALEARVQAFSADPIGWIRGRDAPLPPPEALPLDRDLLARVRAAREAERETVLVTSGPAERAEALSDALGLFDRVVALPAGPDRPARLADALGREPEMAAPARPVASRSALQIKAMRPHQWSKNLLVFLPALAAHDIAALWLSFAAFVAFSLTASSVYILNDISDLAADRVHPRKCKRPFAAGVLTVGEGMRLAAGLIIGAVAISLLFASPAFLGALGLYFVATFAYSFWLKRKLVIDVILLAALYTLRILAGAVATGVFLSPWMLGFSMFVFLSLAAVKRQAELTDMAMAGESGRAGRGYVPEDLPVIRSMALAAGYAAVLVLALYISSDDVSVLYSSPEALWLLCPILLYWISRMVMNTHRGKMTDDPIVYAATDRVSQGVILTGALVIAVAAAF